ncbi:Tetratricopeptide repeat protein [Gemmata obscuriglobus]|uniref:DUF4339 domain-containing protein n=1 Tax=Gemmata obscuriglobus TaxID=114 RepID=A0A2Z3H3P3_9BACT|nr:tetratricopeptide repeat protein [Gemmata obscuriglobus]AWM35590.1 DUF4339 domain-containing protein [Gemmata obscuriglobus]QEG31888.1 Tetratricopeptide repeat protein [Gemmata obscuriglobus]VTS11234.1 peptidase c14 : Uncharacterized protein OS=Methanosarcina acetivorans (strain ATCC 35395 / DSM 2834 / JCM 12185 / C2A) GN=MA_3293 PE=4 SV=1: DUF4339: TPR_12 [Gemmata obscuriglobus UQM 2246]
MPIDWYYTLNGVERGPATVSQIDQLVAAGVLRPTDLAWRKVAARGREAQFLVANLLGGEPEDEGQRLVAVAARGRSMGGGLSTGHWHDACAAHQEATCWALAALAAQAALRRPDVPANAAALAECYFALGALHQSAGRLGSAGWALDEAGAIRERLARSAPRDHEYQQALAASFNQRGLLHRDLGALDEAKASIGKAVAIRSQLLQARPNDPWTAVLLGGALCNLGAVLCDQGRYPEALDQYEQAVPLIEGQLAERARVGLSALWGWLFPRARSRRRSLESTARSYLANTQAGRARVLELLGG